VSDSDRRFLAEAFAMARKSYDEGGVPVGAVMVQDGQVIARGHNRRVQHDDSVSHGETDCLRQAGLRDSYDGITLYTTLSPCMMCSGSVLQFGIERVVIGEDVNFPGNAEFLRERGIEVVMLDDADCKGPDIWFEDIAGREEV